MRVLVCGGRMYGRVLDDLKITDPNYEATVKAAKRQRMALTATLNGLPRKVTTLIQGGAKGADALAAQWAYERGIPVSTFAANWDKDGKAAGPIRNQRMLEQGVPDLVVAFAGGTGTADMIKRARAAGVEVLEVIE